MKRAAGMMGFLVLCLAACTQDAGTVTTITVPSTGTTVTTVPPTTGSTAAPNTPEVRSTAGVILEPSTIVIPGLAAPTQPAPGAVLTPEAFAIGGGPTDAGAETIEEIISLAEKDVGAYWETYWETEYPTVFYEPPSAVRLYDSSRDEFPDTTCAAGSTDPTTWAFNAFYCFGDRVIVYDVVYAGHELGTGDYALVGTVAHEWGHHLQNLLAGSSAADHPTFSIEAELQADCFAGVYTKGAGVSGSFPVDWDDVVEAAKSFYLSGGETSVGWFEPVYHGTRDERYQAFAAGFNSGEARTCDIYATYMLDHTWTVGPYAIGYLPGSEASTLASGNFRIGGPPYGDVLILGNAFTVDVSGTFGAAIFEALVKYAPNSDGTDTTLTPLGTVDDHTATTQGWGIPGGVFGFFYTQQLADGAEWFGYAIVNVIKTGDALVLDVTLPGTPDVPRWQAIGDTAERTLRSFQAPGVR